MTVHSIHVFDRKGKTLYTKTYSSVATKHQEQLLQSQTESEGGNPLEEQRKLVFGMIFSLRELVGSLTPKGEKRDLHSIKTGSATVHNYVTPSGLHFALYTSHKVPPSSISTATTKPEWADATTAQEALRIIYAKIWIECVVKSPLYQPGNIKSVDEVDTTMEEQSYMVAPKFDVATTNFEKRLDRYLSSLPWFRVD